MENSAPSNVWTYYARWHRYFDSLIETNVFEISCLLAPSNVWTHNTRWHRYLDSLIETNAFEITCLLYISFCFVILYVTIWCKDNKLIIYLSVRRINWFSIYNLDCISLVILDIEAPMVCLVRAACWGFTACQSLVSIYWALRITGSP